MKRSIYIKTGIIVALTFAAFIWGLNFLKGKIMFADRASYYVIYDRIDGLEVSNAVLINGYKVGQVTNIGFLPDTSGRLIVEFTIGQEYQLPKSTIAQIFSSDLMGTKSITLNFSKNNELQQPGDTLIADFEGSLTEMVSVQMLPLKNKAEDLMKEMEKAITVVTYIFNEAAQKDIRASLRHMKQSFNNLESSSSNLDSIVQDGKSNIANILNNIESITTNLEKSNNEISNLIKNLSNISDTIAQVNLYQMLLDMESAIGELNSTLQKIENGQGTIGKLVNNDSLYYNLEDATYNLNRLLEDFRLNPKRYVHFSAFDMGKTVIVEDDSKVEKKKSKPVYKIQIAESNKSIPLTPNNFKGYKNIEEASINGIYIYMYSSTKNIDKARSALSEIKNDYPEANILKIQDGKYLKIE